MRAYPLPAGEVSLDLRRNALGLECLGTLGCVRQSNDFPFESFETPAQVRVLGLLRRELSPIGVQFDDAPVESLDAPRKRLRLFDWIRRNGSCCLGDRLGRCRRRDPQPLERVVWETVAEGKLVEFPNLGKSPQRIVRLVVGLAIHRPVRLPEAELVPKDLDCGRRLEFATLIRICEHFEKEQFNALGVIHEFRGHALV